MPTNVATAFDAYCSDGTVRERFLALWSLGSTCLHQLARLMGLSLHIQMGDHVLVELSAEPALSAPLAYHIATHCTPDIVATVRIPESLASLEAARVSELFQAYAKLIGRLFEAEVGVHLMASNMAHEIAILLVGTGMAMQTVDEGLRSLSERSSLGEDLRGLHAAQQHILADSRLGLFLVRNFLSASSGTPYGSSASVRHSRVSLETLVTEMLDLYTRIAARRGIGVRRDESDPMLPDVRGDPDELKRALHNVLSNAVKYSYRSGGSTERFINVRTKLPYDPGFRKRRLGLEISNYGLGLSESEQKKVFQYGFRGQQAVDEVAVGSGIGLSEVRKIMASHNGVVKLVSRPVHDNHHAGKTYVTTVTLVLPYEESGGSR